MPKRDARSGTRAGKVFTDIANPARLMTRPFFFIVSCMGTRYPRGKLCLPVQSTGRLCELLIDYLLDMFVINISEINKDCTSIYFFLDLLTL